MSDILKVYIGVLIAVVLIGFSGSIISNVINENKITKLEKELTQKKQKIEVLQKENTSMTDHIWIMNQKFMKEGAE